MLFQQEKTNHLNTITRYGEGYFEINGTRYQHSICMRVEGEVNAWPISDHRDITLSDLEKAAGLKHAKSSVMDFLDGAGSPGYDNAPELLVIGTGKTHHFLPLSVTAPFLEAGIGVEVMHSLAAARTYNILISEGRRVALALIIP